MHSNDFNLMEIVEEMRSKAPEGIMRLKPESNDELLVIICVGKGCSYVMDQVTTQAEDIIRSVVGDDACRVEENGEVTQDWNEDAPTDGDSPTIPWLDI